MVDKQQLGETILYVILSIDVEPDISYDNGYSSMGNKKIPQLSYQSLETVINLLPRLHICGARWNWMVEADNFIEAFHNDTAFMFNNFKKEWRRIEVSGDEVGFHPHIYRQDGIKWVQERDPNKQVELLRDAFTSISRQGFKPQAVKTGWAMMTSVMMRTLDELGFIVDLSALPGLVFDKKYSYNWLRTPQTPYHPSSLDYQQPGDLNIIEIPQTINSVKRFWRSIFISPFNPCGRSKLYKPCIIDAVKNATKNGTSILAGYTHLSDIINPKGQLSKITGKTGIEHFEKTILYLLRFARQYSVKIRFLTASEICVILQESLN